MKRRRIGLLASITVLASLAFAGVSGTASALDPVAAPWKTVAQLALGTEDVAVSCAAGTTTCWAIESGHLLSSADAGATWADRTAAVPIDVTTLTDLDCPTAGRCYVVARLAGDTGGLFRIDNGMITAQAAPGAGALVESLSCTGKLRCFATDGMTVWVTSTAAASWHAYTLPTFVHSNPDIGCILATTTCTIVGDNGETPAILRSGDGARHWVEQTAPSPTDGLYDVACPTTTTCYGAGANFADNSVIIRTANSGGTWSFAGVPGSNYAYRSISCVTETICVAVGNSPADTPFVSRTTDGVHWTAQSVEAVETASPYQVSCVSTTTCTLVGSAIGDFTTDSGTTWTPQDLPAAIEAPSSMSCPTVRHCVGVGNDGAGRAQAITSDDRARTWVAHPMPAGVSRLAAVDCPSSTDCYAVASDVNPSSGRFESQALHSSDSGVTWQLGRIDNKRAALRNLTCASATTCIAGGFDNHSNARLVRTTDSGAHWMTFAPPSGFYLDGIGCSSVTSCVVVTSNPEEAPNAWTTDDLGATYHRHKMPNTEVFAFDCTDLLCVGAGADGGSGAISTSTDGGVTWTRSTVPTNAQIMTEVSCGSATQCATSSFNFSPHGGPIIASTVDGGQTWRTHKVSARNENVIALSCLPDVCFGSDYTTDGNPIIVSGRP